MVEWACDLFSWNRFVFIIDFTFNLYGFGGARIVIRLHILIVVLSLMYPDGQ